MKSTIISKNWKQHFLTIEQIMRQDLFTVLESDVIDLVANIMNKRNIHHVPVENDDGRLVGMVNSKQLIQYYNETLSRHSSYLLVKEIMAKDHITVSPETKINDAIQMMNHRQANCLPVVKNRKLVGLVTAYDFVKITSILLQQMDTKIPVKKVNFIFSV